MLFLDGVYLERCNGLTRFQWIKAPTRRELTQLAYTIAQRVGRFLERKGRLERDAENSYLAADAVDGDPMAQLLGHFRSLTVLRSGHKQVVRYSPCKRCRQGE